MRFSASLPIVVCGLLLAGCTRPAPTADLPTGKIVAVEDRGQDRYDRTLGHVFIDGIDVYEHLVEQGMAWHYKRYEDSASLSQTEERARRAKRELWQDREPVPPWEWRKLDKDERQRRREASAVGAE